MTNPLISVIIPTYNRADVLGSAISSVLHQTYRPVQLIVIDDGSNDHTREVVRRFPGVQYGRQRHAGQGAARNNGLREARGSFIATLDSDDTWDPGFLSHCLTKLETAHLDFVFTNWIQKSRDQEQRDYLRTYPALTPFIERERDNWVDLCHADLRDLYVKGCPSPSSSALIRKSSISSGWDESIHIGDDWAMFLNMILSKKCGAAFCLEQLWTKNINDLNIYDGRPWEEVLRLLYVDDMERFLSSYAHLMNDKEIGEIRELHLKGLLNLALYKLFKKRKMRQSFELVKRSFCLNARQTLRVFPLSVKTCLDRRLKTTRYQALSKNL